ncbi:unnamed protein product [Pichia kudriavzevii]
MTHSDSGLHKNPSMRCEASPSNFGSEFEDGMSHGVQSCDAPDRGMYTTSYCPIKDTIMMHKSSSQASSQASSQVPSQASSSCCSTNSAPCSPTSPLILSSEGRENKVHCSNSMTKLKLENRHFTNKADIKPWLQRNLASMGIHIVIERSDDTKIVFKCKYSDKKPLEKNNCKSHERAARQRKKKVCPFRIRANYSIRSKHWTLVIVNDSHNHPISSLDVNIADIKSKLSIIDQKKSNHRVTKPKSLKHKDHLPVPRAFAIDPSNALSSTSLTCKPYHNSLIPPILNENTHAKVKLPPISLPDNSLNNQVRQIEDTLKTFQQVGNIPNVSKEKILKDVWCVLNKSINEITDSNSGSFPLPLPLPLPHQKMGRVSQRQSFQLFNTNNNIENNVINGNLENSNTSSRSSSNSYQRHQRHQRHQLG